MHVLKGVSPHLIEYSPLQREDNHRNAQVGCGHLKLLFTKIIEPKELECLI
jgi:hypothetical protein